MNVSRILHPRALPAVSALLLAAAVGACSSARSLYNMPPGVDPAERLDSLAALSQGDYIHIQFSPCLGKCDGYVSIYRTSPASYHTYEAEGWTYNQFERGEILQRVRVPIDSDVADEAIRRSDSAGLMRLVDDTTRLNTTSPYLWVRARIGERTLALDHVYLGSQSYASTTSALASTYANLRLILLGYMQNIRIGQASEAGR